MKSAILLTALLLSATVSSVVAENRYTISGSLTNQGSESIQLSYRDGGELITNSAQATNGAFTLSGPAPSQPVFASLNTGVDRRIHLGLSKRSMFIAPPPLIFILSSNSDLTVSGSAEGIHMATVEGDEFNRTFNELRQAEQPYTLESDQLRREFADLKLMGDEDGLKALGPKMLENHRKLAAVQKQFINSHPASLVSVWLLTRMEKDYVREEYKQAFESLAPELQNSDLGRQIAGMIEDSSAPRNPRSTGTPPTGAANSPK